MKIIVSGSTGFIGSKFLEKYKNIFEIHTLTRDELTVLDKFDELDDADLFLNLASNTNISSSWEEPEKFIGNNINIMFSVLSFCRKKNIKLITISSYMYGATSVFPTDESVQVGINNPYALSKYINEQLVEFYANNFQLDACVLRLFNVYGRGQNSNFLISDFITQAVKNSKIVMRDSYPKRDYIHIDDLIEAIYLICIKNELNGYKVYNICSGQTHSVLDIAKIVASCVPNDVIITENKNVRVNEIYKTLGSFKKFNNDYGWVPRVELKNGIENLVKDVAYEHRQQ